MSINLPETAKDYYIFVKQPDLLRRAQELNMDNFVLCNKEEFDQEDLDTIISTNKIAVKLDVFPDADKRGFLSNDPITESGLCITTFNGIGTWIDDDDREVHIQSIQDLSDELSLISLYIEVLLDRNGVTLKCGNCHNQFKPADKYCRICGTERSKGVYFPYKEQCLFLYGAPIKKKYKCAVCNNIWISPDYDSKYCPECGSNSINYLNPKSFLLRYLGDPYSSYQPYDSTIEPILFTEDQVTTILQQRKPLEDYDFFMNRLNTNEILSVMKNAGIPVLDENCPTEKEADCMNLVKILFSTEGDNPYAYSHVECPHCKSKMLAGFCYDIKIGEKIVKNKAHMPAKKNAVTYYEEWTYKPFDNDRSNRPAYLCLQCGDYFGDFSWPKEQLLKYI